MANRTVYGVMTPKNEVQLLTARLLSTGGAAAPTLPEATNNGGGEIKSVARAGVGLWNIVFRKTYPLLLCPMEPSVVGATIGLGAIFTAFNAAAGTATIQLSVGSVATDPAANENIYLSWLVRNTGRNP